MREGGPRHAARLRFRLSRSIDPAPHPVAGSLDRRHLDPVLRWVTLNRAVLIRYWNGEIGTGGLVLQLQPLPSPDQPTQEKPAPPPRG